MRFSNQTFLQLFVCPMHSACPVHLHFYYCNNIKCRVQIMKHLITYLHSFSLITPVSVSISTLSLFPPTLTCSPHFVPRFPSGHSFYICWIISVVFQTYMFVPYLSYFFLYFTNSDINTVPNCWVSGNLNIACIALYSVYSGRFSLDFYSRERVLLILF
jgi:hypothetical protein